MVFGGWQAGVKVDRQWSFPILDRLLHIMRVKSHDQEDDSE